MKPFLLSFAALLVLSATTLLATEVNAVSIHADTTRSKNNATYATGHVRITHRDSTMQADHAVYDASARRVTLDGNVQFERREGKEVVAHLTAPHIVYFLDGQIDVRGPSRMIEKNQ